MAMLTSQGYGVENIHVHCLKNDWLSTQFGAAIEYAANNKYDLQYEDIGIGGKEVHTAVYGGQTENNRFWFIKVNGKINFVVTDMSNEATTAYEISSDRYAVLQNRTKYGTTFLADFFTCNLR